MNHMVNTREIKVYAGGLFPNLVSVFSTKTKITGVKKVSHILKQRLSLEV